MSDPSYVAQLSPKKQDKALIHARRAANIRTVLIDKKTTSVESAQFRYVLQQVVGVFLTKQILGQEDVPVASYRPISTTSMSCPHLMIYANRYRTDERYATRANQSQFEKSCSRS